MLPVIVFFLYDMEKLDLGAILSVLDVSQVQVQDSTFLKLGVHYPSKTS